MVSSPLRVDLTGDRAAFLSLPGMLNLGLIKSESCKEEGTRRFNLGSFELKNEPKFFKRTQI